MKPLVTISSLSLETEKYGFIVDLEEFTSKKLTTKITQQMMVRYLLTDIVRSLCMFYDIL